MLSLALLQQSHTGEVLASFLEQTLHEWGISANKVLHIVSDNGINMIKAIGLMQEKKKQRNTEKTYLFESEDVASDKRYLS